MMEQITKIIQMNDRNNGNATRRDPLTVPLSVLFVASARNVIFLLLMPKVAENDAKVHQGNSGDHNASSVTFYFRFHATNRPRN